MTGKTTRTTVERDRIIIIRHARIERGWCPVCCAEVDVINLERETLAEALGTNEARGWITGGKLQFDPASPTDPRASASLRCLSV